MKRSHKQLIVTFLIALLGTTALTIAGLRITKDFLNRKMVEAVAHDQRTPEEVVNNYLAYRAKLLPKSADKVTEGRVRKIAEDAACLLKKQRISEQHPRPRPCKYEKCGMGEHNRWLGVTTEELMNEPLDCVRNIDGICMLQLDGRACLLKRTLADAVTQANEEMFKARKEQMQPLKCYETHLSTAVAYVLASGKGCEPLDSSYRGLRLPGTSYHEVGLAMDLANHASAKLFLEMVGMECGRVQFDDGHCALGENPGSRVRYLKKTKPD